SGTIDRAGALTGLPGSTLPGSGLLGSGLLGSGLFGTTLSAPGLFGSTLAGPSCLPPQPVSAISKATRTQLAMFRRRMFMLLRKDVTFPAAAASRRRI